MAVLIEYDTLAQAELAKSHLDGAQIWSMINNEYMSTIYPVGVMPAQIIVMKNDLERSRMILSQMMSEESEIAVEQEV